MAGPEITDNPAKLHHHPTRCSLNLPHPPALMKLMEGISDMLFLLSRSRSHYHCRLFNGSAADVEEKVLCCSLSVFSLDHDHEMEEKNEYVKHISGLWQHKVMFYLLKCSHPYKHMYRVYF